MFMRLVANSNEPENGNSCWVWKGSVRRHRGYNRPAVCIRVSGKPVKRNACRVMLGLFHQMPANMETSHLCDNPLCINPDHLAPESRSGNTRRIYNKNLPIPKLVAMSTPDDPDWKTGVICDPLEIPF